MDEQQLEKIIKGSILEQEPPPESDFINRIRFCIKALAYGVINNLWSPEFKEDGIGVWYVISRNEDCFETYFNNATTCNIANVWKRQYPQVSFLKSFGYITETQTNTYVLNEKAYQLLETPLTPPKIFISYRRGVSTVLGLLIVARLRALSSDLNPFIDKELEIGAPWEAQLREKVAQCDTFISLVGSKDSFSNNVMNEIRWAMLGNKKIISIWHGDYTSVNPQDCPDNEIAEFLSENHAIAVKGSQAIDYEMAITLLENELHYYK